MSNLQVEDKKRVISTYSQYHVVKAQKGWVGTIKSIRDEHIIGRGGATSVHIMRVEQENGNSFEVPVTHLELYAPKTNNTVKNMSSEALLDHYDKLIKDERNAQSIKTKSYQTVLTKLDKARTEILSRMGAEK